MVFLTTDTQNKILAHMLNGVAYSAPTSWYIGLATNVAADGTITGEPTTNGYARKQVATNNTTIFGAAANGIVTNTGVITFDTSTSTGWGAVTKWFASTASSGGTIIAYGALGQGITVLGSQAPSFPASQFTLDAHLW